LILPNGKLAPAAIQMSRIARFIVIFASIIYLLFYLLQGEYLLFGNTDRGDLQLPLIFAARSAINLGQGPWWNPTIFTGTPLWGNPALFLWYPLNWPIFAVPNTVVILTSSLIAWAHYIGTFITSFIYFRVLIRDERWAAFSALAYGFSLPVAYGLSVGDAHLPVYLFLPLNLYFIHTFNQRRLRWTIIWLTLAITAQITGGFLQHTAYGLVILLGYGLYMAWQAGSRQILLQRVAALSAAFSLAILLAAPAIVPIPITANETSRKLLGQLSLSTIINGVLATSPDEILSCKDEVCAEHIPHHVMKSLEPTPPDRLLRLLLPNGFGFDIAKPYINYVETMLAFCGVSTLFFAGIPIRRTYSEDYFWIGMVIVILLLVITPLVALQIIAFGKIPILHGRLAFFLPLGLSALAGTGGKILERTKWITWSTLLVSPFSLLAILIFLLNYRWLLDLLNLRITNLSIQSLFTFDNLPFLELVRGISLIIIFSTILLSRFRQRISLVWLAVAILLLEIVPSTYLAHRVQVNPLMISPTQSFFAFDQINRPLPVSQTNLDEFRLVVKEPTPSRSPSESPAWAKESNQGVIYGYNTPWGYANAYSIRYATLVNALSTDSQDLQGRQVYFDPLKYPRLADLTSVGAVFKADTDWHLVANRYHTALPRASLFFDYEVEPDYKLAAQRLAQQGFNIVETVILNRHPEGEVGPQDPQAKTTIAKSTPNQVIIQVQSATPALLLLTDNWATGWQAVIDDKNSTTIMEANVAFRAVLVPAGEHKVTFTYHPPGLAIALGLTSLAVIITGALLISSTLKRYDQLGFLFQAEQVGKISIFILLWGLSLVFTVYTWWISHGIPYFRDANETYSAFMHGWNLYAFSAWENAFLSDVAVNPDPAAHPFTYTHGPNLPRYISFVFIVLGVKTAEIQVLLAAFIATGLTLGFMYALFRKEQLNSPVIAILAFFATDFMGVLQWLGNLFRVWHFPLFFGCLLSTRWKSHPWFAFLMFFLVFQLDLTFGVFTLITCLALLILWEWHEPGTKVSVAMAIGGAVVSIGVFIMQLIAFYGWNNFLLDMTAAYRTRNMSVEWSEISSFYKEHNILMWITPGDRSFRNFFSVLITQLGVVYSPLVKNLMIFGLVLSALISLGKHLFSKHRAIIEYFAINEKLAKYLWAPILAIIAMSFINPGYTLANYVQGYWPMLVFPVLVSLVLLCFNLVGLSRLLLAKIPTLARFAKHDVILPTLWLIALIVPWIASSVIAYQTFPPYINEAAKYLSSDYRGHSFAIYTTFPEIVSYYTKNWAIPVPFVFGPDENLAKFDSQGQVIENQNADRFTNPDYRYPEFYLCQEFPYFRGYIDCQDFGKKLEQKGHTIEVAGKDFVIIRLTWWNPPETLEDNPQAIARFVPSGQKITVGSQVTTVSGNTSLLEADDLVLFNNHLLRVESDGQLTPLLGEEGQSIWIENLGPWDQHLQARTGLPAYFHGGQWVIDPTMSPVNPNFNFTLETNDDSIPSWTINPADASYIVERLEDETSSFIRVSAKEDIPYLTIGQRPNVAFDEPIWTSLLVQIRASSGSKQILFLSDKLSPNDNPFYKAEADGTTQWQTLAIPWVAVQPPPDAHYAVGLTNVKAGDWFDIREFSVFIRGPHS
jgi:hypothetical protein